MLGEDGPNNQMAGNVFDNLYFLLLKALLNSNDNFKKFYFFAWFSFPYFYIGLERLAS